ncbi:hypothetical protein [Parasphingopyxis sp.]|uniref:hypothetical protein n=1 Tax=Parasphingopyxis sp. TaxID=1920299 RepID=UPI00263A05A0|nr:hypothetical protein [Parasphingopyxis sp.]
MKVHNLLPGGAIAAVIALTACSGEAGAQAEDTDMEAGDTATDEMPAEEEATTYAEDETGGQINPDLVEALNGKLADFHAESGRTVHLILAMTTGERDVEALAEAERAARDADALIYIAGADQALAIVGGDLDERFTTVTELTMVDHFEENRLAEGLNSGVDAVIAELGN